MEIKRKWAMPNSNTFLIKPINELVTRYCVGLNTIDPFARNSKIAKFTNDIDPKTSAEYHLNALDFLKTFHDDFADCILFDPPYSPSQVSECYKSVGLSCNMQDTSAAFWGNLKKEIARVLKINGICLTFGWCSNGIGKKYNFEIIEILLVAHGGWHNDTICTVEKKLDKSLEVL